MHRAPVDSQVLRNLALCDAKRTHVPYRDHVLTRVLRHALGGSSRTIMAACACFAWQGVWQQPCMAAWHTAHEPLTPSLSSSGEHALLPDLVLYCLAAAGVSPTDVDLAETLNTLRWVLCNQTQQCTG